jgi:hypothetical protein
MQAPFEGRNVCAAPVPFRVMPGFMPGIHALAVKEGVDGRDKPGHDEREIGVTNP